MSLFSKDIQWSTEENREIVSMGALDFSIHVQVPKDSILILEENQNESVQFSIENENFQILKISSPKGKFKNNFTYLKQKGMFTLKLFDLAGLEMGTNHSLDLVIHYTQCDIHFKNCNPKTSRQELFVLISGERSLNKFVQARNSGVVNWIKKYTETLDLAAKRNQNIFAIITDPSWCGACAHMERITFSKKSVQDVLNNKFVSFRAEEDEYSKLPISGSFGIPTYFILDQKGKMIQKYVGARDEKSFLNLLKTYEKNPNGEEQKEDVDFDIDELKKSLKSTVTIENPKSEGIYFQMKDVNLNGKGSIYISNNPGETIKIESKILFNCITCGNKISQVLVGIAEEKTSGKCIWSGIQKSGGSKGICKSDCGLEFPCGVNPGRAGWEKLSYTYQIPKNKGVYRLRTLASEECADCSGISPDAWGSNEKFHRDNENTIGFIIVK